MSHFVRVFLIKCDNIDFVSKLNMIIRIQIYTKIGDNKVNISLGRPASFYGWKLKIKKKIFFITKY